MKTISQKIMLQMVLVLLVKFSLGQTLLMNGRLIDEDGRRLHGYYELRNSHKKVLSGMGTKLKIELKEKEIYTLILSKPGYQTKRIIISAFSDNNRPQIFLFDVILNRMNYCEGMRPEINAGYVFYDSCGSLYFSSLNSEERELQLNTGLVSKK